MQILSLDNFLVLNNSSKGIYRNFLVTEGGNSVDIHRLIGVDQSGLTYIDSSETNSISIEMFLHSMDVSRRQNNHSGGLKICNNLNLQKFLENKQLRFDFIVKNEARNLERELSNKCKNEFGEVPPLNG